MYFQVKEEHEDKAGSDEKRAAPEAGVFILLGSISVHTKQNKIFNSGRFLFRVNFYVQVKSRIIPNPFKILRLVCNLFPETYIIRHIIFYNELFGSKL